MPEQVTLKVQKRTIIGKHVKQLRREGLLPANIYGSKRDSVSVQVNARELERIFRTHGHTTFFRLSVEPDGGEDIVLVRHVQRAPTTGAIQHVDFLHVDLAVLIKARIPVRVVGESPAVKLLDGVLVHTVDTLEVEALPGDLPEMLRADISALTELNSALFARDIVVPKGVTLLADADETIIKVTAPRVAAAEPTAAAEAPAAPAATPES